MVDRLAEERENTRRETEAKAAECGRRKSTPYATSGAAACRRGWPMPPPKPSGSRSSGADAARRRAGAPSRGRARLEIDALTRGRDEAAERHRQEIDAVREEWQGRLQAGLADATGEADRRVDRRDRRIRREVEAGARPNDRARCASDHEKRNRREPRAQLAPRWNRRRPSVRLRDELEQAAAQATARLREKWIRPWPPSATRAGVEIEGERARVQALLAAERDRSAPTSRPSVSRRRPCRRRSKKPRPRRRASARRRGRDGSLAGRTKRAHDARRAGGHRRPGRRAAGAARRRRAAARRRAHD